MIGKLVVILLSGVICLLGATTALAYNEAPMLRVKVAAGELPPVEERLPKEPFVVGPGVLMPEEDLDFEIGQYGGTERLITQTAPWEYGVFIQCNEPLVSAPGLTTDNIRGNVLKDYSVSPDQRVFTFRMREGLKWSDGVPVTADDVLFAYEDVLLNEKLTPAFPAWLKSGNRADGEPMKLEIVDNYTFQISFAEPYGGFLVQLAINYWKGYFDLLKPKHYMKQFHPRYTPLEELEPLIKKEALAKGEWWTLFHKKDITTWELGHSEAIGFPVLSPWMTVYITPTTIALERNPYYFKVDTAGNQLPYIDRLSSTIVTTLTMVDMKIIAGEVDHSYQYGTLPSLPLYKENAEKGGYRVILYDYHIASVGDFALNMTYPDPVWRQIVRDIRFRKALSMAINREEIIDAIYYGFASLPQSVPSDYDPERANQILDEMGLDRRDADGWRLRPDGKRLVIPIEYFPHFVEIGKTAELMVEYWTAVGIQTTAKLVDGPLLNERKNANQLKATAVLWPFVRHLLCSFWGCEGAGHFGTLWNLWSVTDGEKGEEPPEEVKKHINVGVNIFLVSPEERPKLYAEFLRSVYENIWWFITVESIKYPVMISKNMGNVAHKGYGIAAQFAGEQYFFKQ